MDRKVLLLVLLSWFFCLKKSEVHVSGASALTGHDVNTVMLGTGLDLVSVMICHFVFI